MNKNTNCKTKKTVHKEFILDSELPATPPTPTTHTHNTLTHSLYPILYWAVSALATDPIPLLFLSRLFLLLPLYKHTNNTLQHKQPPSLPTHTQTHAPPSTHTQTHICMLTPSPACQEEHTHIHTHTHTHTHNIKLCTCIISSDLVVILVVVVELEDL